MSKRIRYEFAKKIHISNYMKKTKVPIIVSGFLWDTNIGKLQVAKNLLKGGGSMAIIRHSSQRKHHLMILASVSFNFPHLTLMAIAKLERLQVFRVLYLTHILRFLLYHF